MHGDVQWLDLVRERRGSLGSIDIDIRIKWKSLLQKICRTALKFEAELF